MPKHTLGGRSMKHFASILHLSALVLLCGCAGGGVTTTSGPTTSPTTGPTTGPTAPPKALDISGNWQFNTTSTTGMPPASIVGSIAESGGSVTGAVHIDDSTCFSPLTTIGLTGTLTGGDISLASTPVEGQVTTLTGLSLLIPRILTVTRTFSSALTPSSVAVPTA